jgi:RND family efflux transporter MFP subunit
MTMSDNSFTEVQAEETPMTLVEKPLWEEEEEKLVVNRRPWLMPLLLGTIIGVGVAVGGMRVISNRPATQDKAVANQTATPGKNTAIAMTVTTANAETTRISRTLNATGSIAARELTPVLPQANGLQIKQVLVKEGDIVKEGQVLAVLDDSVIQTQILQAKADVESRQADVASREAELASRRAAVESSKASVASSQAIVQQRQADLAQAKARLTEAQRNFERIRQLTEQGAESKQRLDTATTNLATASEAVRLAEANIRSAQANVSSAQATIGRDEATVRSATAQVNSAQANVRSNSARVQQLRTQLGQTAVRAPVSGIVAEKLVRVGDITGVPPQTQVGTVVGGTQKLFSIIRDGGLELQALIPETQLPQIKVGANVQVTSDADNRIRLEGRIREIEPVVNDRRREATVKIDLPATGLLKPGMFARALINTNSAIGVAVQQKAVLPQPDGSSLVYVLNPDNTVRATKVEVGEILKGGKVEIKSGLQPGARVIIDGAGYLKDGDRVRVANG